jgi:hypothetical protein
LLEQSPLVLLSRSFIPPGFLFYYLIYISWMYHIILQY